MEQLSAFRMTVISILLIVASVNLVKGQISTPCTTSMITNFTPCANYITGSTNNGLTGSSNMCCDSLESMMSTSMDCACLVISANAPFPIPINQALALFLQQTCNINGVTAQCKASGSALPAPGPAILGSHGSAPPPIANSPLSPQGEAPKSGTLQLQSPAVAPAESKQWKQKRPRKLQ